ncbi:MAG: hypothetical protein AAB392_01090 [Patescibacteria group bacterium]
MRATIIILILLAVGALFIFSKNNGGSIIDLSEGILINQDGIIEGNYSIEDIQGVGKPYDCSFRKTDELAQVSGSIRLTENMVRGDFDIDIDPKATNFGDSDTGTRAFFASHFIVAEGVTYTWTSLQNIGYKSEVVKSAKRDASQAEQAQIVGLSDKIDYHCEPWNANLTIFQPPNGIEFVELK